MNPLVGRLTNMETLHIYIAPVNDIGEGGSLTLILRDPGSIGIQANQADHICI